MELALSTSPLPLSELSSSFLPPCLPAVLLGLSDLWGEEEEPRKLLEQGRSTGSQSARGLVPPAANTHPE